MVIGTHLLHLREQRHTADEQRGGQAHPNSNGQHHVEHHGQNETHQQDGHIPCRRGAQRAHEQPRLTHVPGHHEQQCRQSGHGHHSQHTGQCHNRKQHHQCMDHGCYR